MKKLLVMIALVALACGKKDDEPASSKPADPKAGDKTGAKPAANKPDVAAWDVAGKKQAWQGHWLVLENGTLQTWSIQGDDVTTWDGAKEEKFKLEAELPCKAEFANDKGYRFPRPFTVTDGKLRFRGGGAGYKKGSEAIFCDASGEVWTLDAAGKCTVWKDKFGEWEKADGECGWKKNDQGAEVFFHKGSNEGDFEVQGDAILAKTSQDTESFPDMAAARAARDAKAAAPK